MSSVDQNARPPLYTPYFQLKAEVEKWGSSSRTAQEQLKNSSRTAQEQLKNSSRTAQNSRILLITVAVFGLMGATVGYAQPVEEVGGMVADDGSGLYSVFYPSIQSIEASVAYSVAQPAIPRLPLGSRLERAIANSEPFETLPVTIDIEEPGFDFARFANASDEEISELVREREATLEKSFRGIQAVLARWGYEAFDRFWLVPRILVPIAVGDILGVFRDLPGGARIDLEAESRPEAPYWSNNEVRTAVGAARLITHGNDGSCCGRGGSRVRVAVIDKGIVSAQHPGWDDTPSTPPGGASRLKGSFTCLTSGCYPDWWMPQSPDPVEHGFKVSWIAMASIEEGQDPSVTATVARRERSGVAREADFRYYHVGSTLKAVEAAVAYGADVANISMSFGDASHRCERDHDFGLDDAVANALDAGTLVFASAGNARGNPACTLKNPALRSEVLAVGALATNDDQKSYTSFGMMDESPGASSAYGGLAIRVAGTSTDRIISGIGLTTPAYRRWLGNPVAYSYDSSNTIGGTSYATPVATGTAALLLDSLEDLGWTVSDKRVLMAHMLLLGDHWDGETGTKRRVGLSKWSGAGRLRAHFPSSGDLTAPWGWGYRAISIANHQTVSWTVGDSGPESCAIQQWKWLGMWTERDLGATADIVLSVWDTCDPLVGERLIAQDASYDLVKKITLEHDDICGKCLMMRALGYSVPAGGRVLYSADYYHAGNPENH